MLIQKEQFREFEMNLFVWMGTEAPEAPVPAPEAPEAETNVDYAAETGKGSETKAGEYANTTENEGEKETDNAEKDPETSNLTPVDRVFADKTTRFAIMEFMGVTDTKANNMSQEEFTNAVNEHKNARSVIEAITNSENTDPKALSTAIDNATGLNKIDKPDEKEVLLLMETDLKQLGKEGLTLLSMTHEIERPKKGEKTLRKGVRIREKGTEKWITINKKNISKVVEGLPKEVQNLYPENSENREDMVKVAAEKIDGYHSAMELKNALVQGSEGAPKGRDKMALIKMIMQILPMIRAAMDGDTQAMQDLMDGYSHYKKTGEMPMEAMANAKEYYAEQIKEIPLKELLVLQGNPRSEEANQIFTKADGPVKFRGKLQEAIQEKIAASLGGGNLQMTNASEGGADMILTQSGRIFNVRISISPDGMKSMDITETTGVQTDEKPTNVEYGAEFTNITDMGLAFNQFRVRVPKKASSESESET